MRTNGNLDYKINASLSSCVCFHLGCDAMGHSKGVCETRARINALLKGRVLGISTEHSSDAGNQSVT